jgi:plastocyanin
MTNYFPKSASVGIGALLILCLTILTVPGQTKLGKRMNDAALHTTAAANPGVFAVVKVSMRNMQFSPRTLDIKKGTVVEWTNDDLVPHTVTSASFDSGSLGPGKSWRHTFTKTGQFPYTCTFHPTMTGVIVVK